MGLYEAGSAIKLDDEGCSFFPDPNLINNLRVSDNLVNRNVDISPLESDVRRNTLVPSTVDGFHEDYDFDDGVLKYINQMLMEEDIEEKTCMFQESAALQAAERSFYEVIGEKYPCSANHEKTSSLDRNGHYTTDSSSFYYIENDGSDGLLCPNWNLDFSEDVISHVPRVPDGVALRSTSWSSYSSPGTVKDVPVDSPVSTLRIPDYMQFKEAEEASEFLDIASCSISLPSRLLSGTITDVPVDSPVSTIRIPDIFSDGESMMQFKKGVEEASKFLPTGNSLLADVRYNVVEVEKYGEKQSPERLRRKKNTLNEDVVVLAEGRNNKQSALFSESTVRSEMFDRVLLCGAGKNESALRETLQAISKGSNGKKFHGKKKTGKRDVVDLSTLLRLCAQAVAAGNHRTANEVLKQIRQSSSPTGDGMQRLAHYFADGLEARMAGSGTHIYKALITRPVAATDVLKAYHLLLAACPFRTISSFFSNKTIWNLAEKASTVHIIDIGIMWGFQWPGLIQRLSSRPGGPPKLRITGIDFPNPGFRPAERVEETGRRLANYAESFKVPFEFNGIAQKWETVKLEDLKINKGEVLAVNCLFRFRNLLDETVVVNSPRDVFLNLIRRLNPDVFIQGIVNGAYNAPFFISRFREALFHYSSLFDMLETIIPREVHERMLVEKNILGQEAMNVIACEGAERIERPETYKQWQVRIMKAGFHQLPLDEEIMRMTTERFKVYDKNFMFDVDGEWLLQGWKGRFGYALSTWKAAF